MTVPFNKERFIVQASTALAGLLLLNGCATLSTISDKSVDAARTMFAGTTGRNFSSRVYTGVSAGATRLSPDTDGTRFTLQDREGGATQLRVGADINSKLSLELDTSILGSAAVREVEADVSYTSITGSALFYALGNDANRERRVGWQGYGRLGYSSLQRASIVQPFDGSDENIVIGLGAEYGFRNGLALRGEVARFDEEATFFGLGVVYRLGLSARQFGNVVASVAKDTIPGTSLSSGEPSLGAAQPETSLAPGHVSLIHAGPNASLWSQPRLANDMDGDSVDDSSDICPDTAANTAVSQSGCGLFDTVLSEVTFKPGTYWLTPKSRRVIDDVVGTLLAFPEARIEVQAHADSEGPDEINDIISDARAEAVVNYMLKHGVGSKQLIAKGYGESQPIATNDTPEGRRKNRRIQLMTLPSLTPLEIASQAPFDASDAKPKVAKAAPVLPKIEVTMKPEELQELAMAAEGLEPHRRQPKTTTIVDEPVVAAALPAEPVNTVKPVKIDFDPAIRIASLGLGGTLQGVNFRPGSTEFVEGSMQHLDTIANQLNANDSVRVALLVHVSEDTDSDTNLSLSSDQADTLIDYLESKGVDRNRLVAEPYGNTLPLAQTVYESDRERNRRIELRVID